MLDANGVAVDTAAEHALVQFAIGSDFFMEMAKFRAARALWAHLVKSCGGGETAQKLTQMAATSSWHQTRIDPWVNLLRGTSQTFSAVLGGVDGIRVEPFDAPFGLPDTFSRRIARNTQLVLRDEAHLREVVDPAGGSWTVESLTQELASRAWDLFQEIEREGGVVAMLQSGALQSRIAELADKQKTMLAQRRLVKVGGNQFAYPEEKKLPERLPDTAATAEAAVKAVAALKASRREDTLSEALTNVNSFQGRVDAITAGASFPEVMAALAGDPMSVTPVTLSRLTDGYEKLRTSIDAYVQAHGSRPVVFMAQMGPVKQHKIRSDFSQEFLKPTGFELDASRTFDDPETAAEAAVERGAAVTVVCSTDDTYPDLVPAFARAVKAASPDTLVLVAGLLPDHTEAFQDAGVDDFIHLRANNLEMLETIHRLTGVSS
jgi:methylmalonyl-CoA mutase